MNFEIDVSGEDLLSKDYTICIADKEHTIRGFKLSESFVHALTINYNQKKYKYKKSKPKKSLLKVRIYCIIIFYLFQDIELNGKKLNLHLCRDFSGREQDIKSNLNYFLGELLDLNLTFRFGRLGGNSNAHHYAYLMRKDSKNKMDTYIELELEDIEKFLRK